MKARIEKRRFTRGWFKPTVEAEVLVLLPETPYDHSALFRLFACDSGAKFNFDPLSTGEVYFGSGEGDDYGSFFLCPNIRKLEKQKGTPT